MTQLPDTSTEQGQREASVMLAKLMGWHIGNKQINQGSWMRVLCDDHGNDLGLRPPFGGGIAPKQQKLVPTGLFNLYDPANMALAWRVLSFAIENFSIPNHHFALRAMVNDMAFFTMPIADAQRAWLDKILTLAIEAGMIEE